MNNEAKFILHAYRPSGADAADAGFADALEHARQDPIIRQWFATQQAFDRAIGAKLGEVAPPAGLREAILTGATFDAAGQGAATRPRMRWQGMTGWMVGLAASVAVLFAASLALWPKTAEATPLLLDFALNDTLRMSHHGMHGREAADFQELLSSSNTRLGAAVPVDFEQLRRLGCRVITFDDRPLLEVCFQRDGTWFHAYVARVSDFPMVAARLKPTFRDENGASAVAWADGQHIFVVASKGGRDALRHLI
jgi:hypothetical protein